MISVVIPLYNKEKLVAHTIQSVLDQTYTDYEVVVVDDGSTDGSAAVVESIHSDKIRLVRQANAGVSAARNRGIEEARGGHIAFLDADDEWKPDSLAHLVALSEKYPSCAVVAHSYTYRRGGRTVAPRINRLPFTGTDGVLTNYFEVASYSDPPLCTGAVMVRRDAVRAVGGFPVGVRSGEDLLAWARLAAACSIAYSREPLAVYNQGFSNPRPPEATDVVGAELETLLKSHPAVAYLPVYVAFWYKMRMCRCLIHGMWGKALRAFVLSLRYNPRQWKIYLSVIKYIVKR